MSAINYFDVKDIFLKTAGQEGYDPAFIEAFFKTAEDQYDQWCILLNSAIESTGDPTLCKRALEELCFTLDHINGVSLDKIGEGGGLLDKIQGMTGQLGTALGGENGGQGLGGAVGGGGMGMLLGMLLSSVLGIPLPLGMLLGALGGGAAGFGLFGTGGGQDMLKNIAQKGQQLMGSLQGRGQDTGFAGEDPEAAPQGGSDPEAAVQQEAAQQALSQNRPVVDQPAGDVQAQAPSGDLPTTQPGKSITPPTVAQTAPQPATPPAPQGLPPTANKPAAAPASPTAQASPVVPPSQPPPEAVVNKYLPGSFPSQPVVPHLGKK